MNSVVIQGLKHLSFLILYDASNMDQLAQDLNNALDGTSDLLSCNKVKKGKTWKCRSKSKCCLIALGSSVPKSSAVSEDSDSSLDNQVPQQMEISMHISHQWSDSDEIISKVSSHNCHLSSWRHCATSMGESDSVNENFQSFREPRRKRKFKRMTIDPPSITDHEFQCLSNVSLFSQKHKRLCNLKSLKFSKHSVKSSKLSKLSLSQLSAEMENICRNLTAASCGKRKRCSHERSIECNSTDCKEITSGKNSVGAYRCSNPHHHKECGMDRTQDASSSGVSSSESDCGLTNDESREADDEQSDFFHESGPASGVPGLPSLWHDNQLLSDVSDSKFKLVLSENIYDVADGKGRFGIQAGRQIRSGRRRLEKMIQPSLSNNEQSLCMNVPFSKEYTNFSASVDNCFGRMFPNEKKKRKRMSAFTNTLYGSDETAVIAPESSIDFRVLKNVCWQSSIGLGPSEEGIVLPVKSPEYGNKQGYGFYTKKNEVTHTPSSGSKSLFSWRNISQSPPPPPPSPQPFCDKSWSPS